MFGARKPPAAAAIALAVALSSCGQSSTKTVTRTVGARTAPATSSRAACGSVAGNFITQIEAAGVDCPTARGVARRWLAEVQRGSDPSKPIEIAGYRCRARFRGQRATALCERGGDPAAAHIAFAAHP